MGVGPKYFFVTTQIFKVQKEKLRDHFLKSILQSTNQSPLEDHMNKKGIFSVSYVMSKNMIFEKLIIFEIKIFGIF